eukprot:3954492-Lingulodinium_polyedra.AAC.1
MLTVASITDVQFSKPPCAVQRRAGLEFAVGVLTDVQSHVQRIGCARDCSHAHAFHAIWP